MAKKVAKKQVSKKKKSLPKGLFENKYGYFSEDGRSYHITRPDTPRPWANVISNGRYGVVISQTGGGFSWLDNANLCRVNRWQQDLIRDDWGKYIYLRDDETGQFWSLTWKPTQDALDEYHCEHGTGYTILTAKKNGILAKLTVFVPPEETLEVWKVEIENTSSRPRSISVFTYFEWLLGCWPDTHREFHKLFLETQYDKNKSIFARKRLWEIQNKEGEGWNLNFAYTGFHALIGGADGVETDKENFIGMYGSLVKPAAIVKGQLSGTSGKYNDSIASLHKKVKLAKNKNTTLVFLTGLAENIDAAQKTIQRFTKSDSGDKALARTIHFWDTMLDGVKITTPDKTLDLLVNTWLPYQAISARIWGRAAYYQSSGAYGFRDQLQDSQIFLTSDPSRMRSQILLHAKHQFQDGTVYHWWHTITEQGPHSKFSDDLLWLPFILDHYLLETNDYAIMDEVVPFVDGSESTLYDHCKRAIAKSLERRSARGLPLIGEGDWNDGLSSCGDKWRGESVWMGHFLYGIMLKFAKIAEKKWDHGYRDYLYSECTRLWDVVNTVAWDGEWYWRVSLDNGEILGSKNNKEAKIFLNAQTWAILHGTAVGARAVQVKKMTEKYLHREYGPLLFYPALTQPDEEIGYLSRYAPGMRENGGLYTHAGIWAIQMECFMKDATIAYEMLSRLNPILRGKNPDHYRCEPYVTPGNVDGPTSPNFGRGGWTWYTGSAAWLSLIVHEWLLGVRPVENGLLIDPCIPKNWPAFKIKRKYRNATYEIEVVNPKKVSHGIISLQVDGQWTNGNIITPHDDGKVHQVRVVMGKIK